MNIKRFYKRDFPEIDDIVIIKITKEDEYGYFCELLEYESIEGFLPLSELVKGRYVKKHLLKINDTLPLIIIKADKNKKTVDLSKKKINEIEQNDVMIKYKTCLNINRLVNEFYVMYLKYCNITESDIMHSINDIMNSTIWQYYEVNEEPDYTIIYNNILENPKLILKNDLFEEKFIDKALNNVKNRLLKKNMLLENEFHLLVNEDEAKEKIKEILNINFPEETDYKLKILIIAPPNYKIKLEGPCKNEGNKILNNIKKNIIEKANKYASSIKFEEPKLLYDSTYEIKYLADFDLQRLEISRD